MGDWAVKHVHEYTFTLPDGSKRYELVTCRADIFRLKKMHGAIAAHPTDTDSEGVQ